MRDDFFAPQKASRKNGERAIIPNNVLSGNPREFAPHQCADLRAPTSMRRL
jgi:hypothetical protein